jgi:hypothetical protein
MEFGSYSRGVHLGQNAEDKQESTSPMDIVPEDRILNFSRNSAGT